MGKAELLQQTVGAAIACVRVGGHSRELLIGGEGRREYGLYCLSGEAEAPMVLVDAITKQGDPMSSTEDEADETNDPT